MRPQRERLIREALYFCLLCEKIHNVEFFCEECGEKLGLKNNDLFSRDNVVRGIIPSFAFGVLVGVIISFLIR